MARKTKKDTDDEEDLVVTKPDGPLKGFVVFLPFGWLYLWMEINERRHEVQRGDRNKESAITSIDNYAVGVIISFVILFIVFIATAGRTQSTIIVPNFIALGILVVSAVHNKHRIDKIEEPNEISEDNRLNSNIDASKKVMDYDTYMSKIAGLSRRLESIDRDDDNFKAALSDIRKDINSFFNECKNADFKDGGKYKLYELRAEYYFVANNKTLAKKYIEEAVEIREKEKRHEDGDAPFLEDLSEEI